MSEILSTTNYEMFQKEESNRNINKTNLKNIVFSIQCNNMLKFKPILVTYDMKIIDGQHRLAAAKQLNIPIFYQIQEKSNDIHLDIVLLNNNKLKWSWQNYLDHYCSIGNQDYIDFREFLKLNLIQLNEGLVICNVKGASSISKFKTGYFVYDNEKQIMCEKRLFKLNECIKIIREFNLDSTVLLKSSKVTSSLINFLNIDELDFELFKQKLKLKVHAVKRCTDYKSYYLMWRSIYNYKNQDPIE